ncbi:Lrp/AsnC family transcriptional regulator [Lysobacter sp. SG-8]|uniref:Lrp/AsnC family transcriptional regulator n=1 Tax=Marilutibacter penaei TaxID=2759900 RepID=A0A7W3U1S1_9GAMM|nr:Lrp/AsnC family transcriptional regulator [Lysobacter penaei]MBB1087381.1 Lrp/AsnC family transcriptional regulator [Lysobacter penaei]
MPRIDRTDFALLRLLRKHARLPNKTLAEKTGVAPSTALERIRRLHEARVIQGYHAEIEPAAIGIGLQAMVAVRLARHSRTLVDGFLRHLQGLPEVLAFYHLAGADDFLVHVGVRDSHHLRELALTAFTERDEVAHIHTQLIFGFHRNTELPVLVDLNDEA